ncbi:unnamed protein product [Heterosigma akashiwo]
MFAKTLIKDANCGEESIKIFGGAGYKLKVKVPLEGKEGFRSIFLDMRGLDSPLDSNLKAKILDIAKKVELSSSVLSFFRWYEVVSRRCLLLLHPRQQCIYHQ